MSSMPEQTEDGFTPTDPGELLTRAKRRSLALRRHRLLSAGGSLAVVLAVAVGGIVITSGAWPSGTIVVSDRIGGAYELTGNQGPPPAAPVSVVKQVERSEVSFSQPSQSSRRLQPTPTTSSSRRPAWRPRRRRWSWERAARPSERSRPPYEAMDSPLPSRRSDGAA